MATIVRKVVTFGGRIVDKVTESEDILEEDDPETPEEEQEDPIEQPGSPPPSQPPVPDPDEDDAPEEDPGPGGVGGPSNPHHPGVPIHPKHGEAPAGTFPCRKCGAWKRTNGQTFTEHGRTVHERMAHKGSKGEGKMGKKKTKEKSKPQEPPEHDEPDIRFAGPGEEERERRDRLDNILYTYERFVKGDEKDYVMRVWDSDEMVRNDPRALSDLLRTLEPMRKNPNILDRIIAATWGRAYGTSPEPPSAYGHYPRQDYGQGGPSYPESGHYGRQGYGYYPQGQGFGPQKTFTMAEVEEIKRRERDAAKKDQDLREQAERIKVLEERAKNPPQPPQPPLTAEALSAAIVTALEKGRPKEEDSQLLKEMRKQNDLLSKQVAEKDKNQAVKEAVKGVTDRFGPELEALRKDKDKDQREAELKKVAEDAAKNAGGRPSGISDETQLILDDNKTTREVVLKVVDKVGDIAEKGLTARNVAAQPIDTHQGKTEGLTPEQEKELRDRLGPDFVD